MAGEIFYPADRIPLVVGASVAARTAMVVGKIPVYTLTATAASGTTTATCLTKGVVDISVKGENNAGNVAVAVGDILYIDTDGEVNKDDTNGTRWGYALEAISSGQTDTIRCLIGY